MKMDIYCEFSKNVNISFILDFKLWKSKIIYVSVVNRKLDMMASLPT